MIDQVTNLMCIKYVQKWCRLLQLAGNQGKVMGVDTSYVEEIPGAQIIRENIEDQAIVDDVLEYFERKVNKLCFDSSNTLYKIILAIMLQCIPFKL
mgnify:CR=1 FL=1